MLKKAMRKGYQHTIFGVVPRVLKVFVGFSSVFSRVFKGFSRVFKGFPRVFCAVMVGVAVEDTVVLLEMDWFLRFKWVRGIRRWWFYGVEPSECTRWLPKNVQQRMHPLTFIHSLHLFYAGNKPKNPHRPFASGKWCFEASPSPCRTYLHRWSLAARPRTSLLLLRERKWYCINWWVIGPLKLASWCVGPPRSPGVWNSRQVALVFVGPFFVHMMRPMSPTRGKVDEEGAIRSQGPIGADELDGLICLSWWGEKKWKKNLLSLTLRLRVLRSNGDVLEHFKRSYMEASGSFKASLIPKIHFRLVMLDKVSRHFSLSKVSL